MSASAAGGRAGLPDLLEAETGSEVDLVLTQSARAQAEQLLACCHWPVCQIHEESWHCCNLRAGVHETRCRQDSASVPASWRVVTS